MTPKLHKGLTMEKWHALPLEKRILNIASELGRAKKWAEENRPSLAGSSIERALELIDLTVEAGVKEGRFSLSRELLRLREALAACYLDTQKNHTDFRSLMKTLLTLDAPSYNLGLEI